MCPDRRSHLLSSLPPGNQRGFLLPVALFIIVVMGFASLALWRTTAQTGAASVQELLSSQAFYAAESGIQAGLSELLYPGAGNRSQADARCSGLNQNLDFSGVEGLNLCAANVQCELVEPGVYELSSKGSCGSGDLSSERSLEVQARF